MRNGFSYRFVRSLNHIYINETFLFFYIKFGSYLHVETVEIFFNYFFGNDFDNFWINMKFEILKKSKFEKIESAKFFAV